MLARDFNRESNPGIGGGAGSSPSTAATNAAMGVASATVAPLTETIRDLVTANRANQPDISAVAAGVGEAYSRVVETLISESKAQRDAANPQEQIKSIIEIAKTLAPPPPPPVDGLIDRVLEAQREANQTTVAMLQAQLADTRNQLLEIQREHREARHGNGNGVPGDGTPNDPLAAIERILEMKKRLDSLTGEPESEPAAGNPAPAPGTGGGDTGLAAILKTVLPMLTPILAPLAQMGAQYMMRQMAAPPAGAMGAMGAMGNPAPAPGATTHNINAPYPEQAATTQPNPQAAQAQAQNPNPHAHAQEANTMIDPTRMFLAAIRQPLMQHLQRQDGAGFAVWLINGFDITTYERLHPLGRDGILALLQAHAPEIYAQITVPDVNMPGAVQPMTSALEFLDAFLDRERVMRLHRGEDDGEEDDYELLAEAAEAAESQTVAHPAAPAPAGTGTGTQSPARKPIVGGGNVVGR